MAHFVRFRKSNRTSTPSVYMQLLSSLASDLDYMLSELCSTPPPPYLPLTEDLQCRSDAFLEPYLQGLEGRQSPDTSEAPSPEHCRLPDPFSITPSSTTNSLSHDNSRESLTSAGDGSEAGSEDSGSGGDSTDTGYGAACDIGLRERLLRTHSVWFLPDIQRAGAFHLLQGKEEGTFVVRSSSQTTETMALSVRLPPDKGPYIEHYLIQSTDGRLSLETSENRFDNIPSLVAHYAQCCDELPVQLRLPRAIRDANTRQKLTSIALLGQEFWTSKLAASKPTSDQSASSPEAEVELTLNPLSTFKGQNSPPAPQRTTRPTPPNTLNLISHNSSLTRSASNSPIALKTPPPPPPRWSKPATPQSNNLMVTATVMFSVNGGPSPSPSPRSDLVQSDDSKRLSPEGQATLSSQGSLRHGRVKAVEHLVSPTGSSGMTASSGGGTPSVLSPDTLSPLSTSKAAGRSSRRTKHSSRKQSRHYQESDILESPTVYYRSAVGDKASDYEDIWGPEHAAAPTSSTGIGFKPTPMPRHNTAPNPFASPDVIPHSVAVYNNSISNTANNSNINNCNNGSSSVLSPAESIGSSSRCSTPKPAQRTFVPSPTDQSSGAPLTPQSDASTPKQGSPFYAEPADSLATAGVVRRPSKPLLPFQQRHSIPVFLQSHLLHSSESPDQQQLNSPMSSSVDNLSPKQRLALLRRPELKPVQPPVIRSRPKVTKDTWPVDNSWSFIGTEPAVNMEESPEEADYEDQRSSWAAQYPSLPLGSPHTPDPEHGPTVHQIISKRFPDIQPSPEIDEEFCRMSSYDNVDENRCPRPPPSETSEQTEFSDPWPESVSGPWLDGSRPSSQDVSENSFNGNLNPHDHIQQPQQPQHRHQQAPPQQRVASISRSKSFKDRLDPLLSPPRLKALRSRDCSEPGAAVGATIRNYALALAQDKTTTFAQNIDNFIACTCDSREINPQIVMRNMRQFMSGMKNYLVKHGEKGFDREVERERNKLKATEFLNLDAILEGVLHRLVIRPLRNHLQGLFVEHYTKTGAIRLLAENIQYASTRPLTELAIKSKITPPSEAALQTIAQYLARLQAADSPLEKLENLLAAISAIFNSVKSSNTGRTVTTLGADDFLPLFVWVLVKTNFVAAEIEAEYMWGLLHPSLLSGEGGYYLTTLSSAVHVLKNFKTSIEDNPLSAQANNDCSSVLKIVVPDELHGSILTKTVPVRPNMTTKQVCKIIAHKARITNPQDYALYRLVDGEETMLNDNECPQDIFAGGKHATLAYKRIDAKIAWPKQSR